MMAHPLQPCSKMTTTSKTMNNDQNDLQTALSKLPDILKKDLEQPLCVCNQVIKLDIIQAIVMGADSLEQVQKQTYASDGTGCCRRQVESLLKHLCEQESNDVNRC